MKTRRVSYEVMERSQGRGWAALRWVEWPHLDQEAFAPLVTVLGTFSTRQMAALACRRDAGNALPAEEPQPAA